MLIYHPAFDAYHCSFQLLLISQRLRRCEIQKARILEFCLSFPTAILHFKLPQEFGSARALVRSKSNRYRDPKSHQVLFHQLQPMQHAALQCLSAVGLLNATDLEKGYVTRTNVPLPLAFAARIAALEDTEPEISDLILRQIASIQLLGSGGLKDRSGLLEHRYDVTETNTPNL